MKIIALIISIVTLSSAFAGYELVQYGVTSHQEIALSDQRIANFVSLSSFQTEVTSRVVIEPKAMVSLNGNVSPNMIFRIPHLQDYYEFFSNPALSNAQNVLLGAASQLTLNSYLNTYGSDINWEKAMVTFKPIDNNGDNLIDGLSMGINLETNNGIQFAVNNIDVTANFQLWIK
jgi:hypothetical protein